MLYLPGIFILLPKPSTHSHRTSFKVDLPGREITQFDEPEIKGAIKKHEMATAIARFVFYQLR